MSGQRVPTLNENTYAQITHVDHDFYHVYRRARDVTIRARKIQEYEAAKEYNDIGAYFITLCHMDRSIDFRLAHMSVRDWLEGRREFEPFPRDLEEVLALCDTPATDPVDLAELRREYWY